MDTTITVATAQSPFDTWKGLFSEFIRREGAIFSDSALIHAFNTTINPEMLTVTDPEQMRAGLANLYSDISIEGENIFANPDGTVNFVEVFKLIIARTPVQYRQLYFIQDGETLIPYVTPFELVAPDTRLEAAYGGPAGPTSAIGCYCAYIISFIALLTGKDPVVPLIDGAVYIPPNVYAFDPQKQDTLYLNVMVNNGPTFTINGRDTQELNTALSMLVHFGSLAGVNTNYIMSAVRPTGEKIEISPLAVLEGKQQ